MIEAFISDIGGREPAHALLAAAVRRVYGIPCPALAYADSGKPFFPARPDICFSLSHSKSHVMVCVSDRPCGCDVEDLRPLRPSVVERVCTPEELEAFSFFELWTLKESFLKLHGVLPYPFWTARFARVPGTIQTPDAAVRAALYPLENAVAALCTPLQPPAALTHIDANFLI